MRQSLKINKYLFMLAIIIILDLDGFYLIPSTFPTDDLNLILKLIFFSYVYLHNRRKTHYTYFLVFIFALVIAFTSSIMAKVNYFQPLNMGLLPQRQWLISLLMYFPISKLIQSGKLNIRKLIKVIDHVNYILIFLAIIQFLAGNRVQLLKGAAITSRYGSARLYISTSFLLLAYFWYLGKFISGEELKWSKIFYLILIVFVQVFIVKSRMASVMLVLSTVMALFSMRFDGKKLFAILALIVALGIFLTSNIGQVMMDSVIGSTSRDAGTQIREVGRTFYLQQIFSNKLNMFFGCGYANLRWGPTLAATRYQDLIYWNDNGIIGLMFYYGFSIVAWLAYNSVITCKNAWKYGNRGLLFFMICGLMGMFSLFPFNYVTNSSFAIVLSLSDKYAKGNTNISSGISTKN